MKKNNKITESNISKKIEDCLDNKLLINSIEFDKEEVLELFYNLENHKYELEMQNQELLKTNLDIKSITDKYTNLYYSAPFCYFTLSKDGKLVDLNNFTCEMLGKRFSELEGQNFALFVSNHYKKKLDSFLKRVFSSSSKQTCELIIAPYNNVPIYVQLIAIINHNGLDCLVIAIEMTKQMLEKEALKHIDSRYRYLFNNSPLGVIVSDEYGEIIEANEEISRATLYSNNELVGSNVLKLTPLDKIDLYNENIQKKLIDDIQDHEVKIFRKDGSFCVFLLRKNIISLANGKKGILSVYNDISSRKKAEEELFALDKKYKIIAENTLDNISILDLNLKFTFISPSVKNLRGFTVEEAMTQKLEEIFTPIHYKEIYNKYLEILTLEHADNAKESDSYIIEGEVYCKDGSTKFVEFSTTILRNSDNKLTGFISVSRDITDRKRADKILHDIIDNNPLSFHIVDKDGFTLKVNDSYILLFGKDPSKDVSVFEELKNENQEFEKLISLAKSGKVVNLPDIYYKSRNLYSEMPNNPIWLKTIIFPLTDSFGKPERFVLIYEDLTQRKQIEESLRVSENRYRLITEKITDVVWVMDLNGKSTFVTPSIKNFTGYSVDEYLSQTINTRFTKESAAIAMKAFENEISFYFNKEENTENYHKLLIFDYICKDGSVKTGEVLVTPYLDENNICVGLHGVTRDITHRILSDRKLLESEFQKDTILNGIKSNIAYVDKDMKIIWANKTAAESVKKNIDEIIGETCHSLWADPLKPCADCPSIKAISSKQAEFTIMHTPDGRTWYERGEPILDNNGDVVGVVEVASDITEQINIEKKLHDIDELYTTILKTSPDAILIFNTNNGLNYLVSPSAVKMFGCKNEDDIIGNSFIDFIVSEDRDRALENIALAIHGKNPGLVEYRGLRLDGSTFDMEANGELIRDSDGIPIQLVTILRDISERKLVEIDLKEKMNEMILLKQLTVGRELKMIELKKEVNELLKKSGQSDKYIIV